MSDQASDPELFRVSIRGVDPQLMIATDDQLRAMVERFHAMMIEQGRGDGAHIPDRVLDMMHMLETTYTYVIARLGAREAAEEAVVYNRPTATVDLELPAAAATEGEKYLTLLNDADDYCRSIEALADLVSPPEVVAFRTWFISEIARQLRMLHLD